MKLRLIFAVPLALLILGGTVHAGGGYTGLKLIQGNSGGGVGRSGTLDLRSYKERAKDACYWYEWTENARFCGEAKKHYSTDLGTCPKLGDSYPWCVEAKEMMVLLDKYAPHIRP